MTKRIKAKFRVCKKIHGLKKNLWGVNKATTFRSVRIFKQNIYLSNQKKNRLTSFGRYLNTKQIIKNFYCNIYEQSFQNYLNKSIISKSKSISKLFSLLESRIDTVLYRSCLVNSLYMSRQLVNHKLVFVNQKKLNSSAFLLAKNDKITIYSTKPYFYSKLISILNQRRFKKCYLISIKTRKKCNFKYFKDNIHIFCLNNRFLTKEIQKVVLKKLNIQLKLRKFKRIDLIPKHLEVNFHLFKIIFLWDPDYKKLYFPLKIEYKMYKKTNKLKFKNKVKTIALSNIYNY